MDENISSLMPSNETISEKTTLNSDQVFFLDPATKEVRTVLGNGPFGTSEYDPKAKAWASLGESDTWRVRDLYNNYVKYKTDWKNDNAFDENDESLALIKFSEGTLDEAWLKENAIFVGDILEEE